MEHEEKLDPGFGKNIEWDIPLLEGYDYSFVRNVSKHPGSKSFDGIINPRLIAKVERWQADVLLVFGWKFKSHLRAMKYFHRRIPVLFRGDSHFLHQENPLKEILRKIVLKNVFKYVDYALYVGNENKKYYLKTGLDERQLVYAPHAIDNQRFYKDDNSLISGISFRKILRIPENEIVFLYAGKLEPVKNPLLFLSTAQQITHKNVHFVFTGNGPLEQDMKNKKGERIHFLDFQNQQLMPGLYQMCDVFVLPSLSETWGLAVNEAMAAGKPVLVSDKCGCAVDLVEDGITGYTFRSNDLEDLKNKIERMASSKDLLKQMGEHCAEKIKAWSFEKIVVAIEEVVNSAD